MRLRQLSLVSALLLAACSSGYTVVQSAPVPAPEPEPLAPMAVTVMRAEPQRVLVQTNRSAYFALFEIVPDRGVALVYPTSSRTSTVSSGLTWVPTYFTLPATPRDVRYGAMPARYVYAIASDRPLWLSDDAYSDAYLRRTLGSAYGASSPYETMRALARRFVPAMPDENWGEAMYAIPRAEVRDTRRMARVYCPDGTVFEVLEEMAGRTLCAPRRTRVGQAPPRGGPRPSSPDSVVTASGRPVAHPPFDPDTRTPVYRIPAPVESPAGSTGTGNGAGGGTPQNGGGTPGSTPSAGGSQGGNGGTPNGSGRDHDDNGRRAHGDPQNADPRGNGNGYGNGGRGNDTPRGNGSAGTPGNSGGAAAPAPVGNPAGAGNPGNPGSSGNNGASGNPASAGNSGNNGNAGNNGSNGNPRQQPVTAPGQPGMPAILEGRPGNDRGAKQDDRSDKGEKTGKPGRSDAAAPASADSAPAAAPAQKPKPNAVESFIKRRNLRSSTPDTADTKKP